MYYAKDGQLFFSTNVVVHMFIRWPIITLHNNKKECNNQFFIRIKYYTYMVPDVYHFLNTLGEKFGGFGQCSKEGDMVVNIKDLTIFALVITILLLILFR